MRCTCKAKQTTLCSHVQQAGNENNIPVVYIQQCMDESADISPTYIHNSSPGTANPSCGEWQRSILGSSHPSRLITRQARVCVIKSYCISSIGAGWIVGRDVQTRRRTTIHPWWQLDSRCQEDNGFVRRYSVDDRIYMYAGDPGPPLRSPYRTSL